jgi:hypothetical protein
MGASNELHTIIALNLVAGWTAIAGGVISGAVIGLFFHDDRWMGGYGSFRRRLTRLGHISFFGIGFLNLLFATSVAELPVPGAHARVASAAFLVAVAFMPACCFLTAWRRPWRHLFPVPVAATLGGVGILLAGWVL